MIFWLIAIGLVFYIILRSVFVAFTHDESITVLEFGSRSLADITNVTYTNNHLLNTLWVHLCILLDLTNKFCFRLPNIISGIIFIFITRKLSVKLFSDEWKRLIFFIGICFHPFVTEFFSLCRGYGISTGVLLLAVWYTFRYHAEERKLRFACFAVIAMIVGTLANYTLLIPLLLLISWFMIDQLFRSGNRKGSVPFLLFLLPVAVLLFWFVRMMFRLRAAGNFDFGGKEGFWSNTVPTLIENDHFFIYEIWNPLKTVLVFISGALFLYAAVVLFLNRKNSGTSRNDFLFATAFLLTGSVLAMIIQHYVLGTFYPEHRAAIYLIPLFSLFIFGTLLHDRSMKIISKIVIVSYTCILTLGYVLSLDLSRSIMWPWTEHFEQLFHAVQSDKNFSSMSKVEAGFEYFNSYNFYNWKARTKTVPIAFPYVNADSFPDYIIIWKYAQDPPASEYDLIDHTEEANLFRLKDSVSQLHNLHSR